MEDLVTRLLDGQLNAVPRILTLLEKGDPRANEIMERITAHRPPTQNPLPPTEDPLPPGGGGLGRGGAVSQNPLPPGGGGLGWGVAHRIGITGPPGAGKSTLVEAITAEFRNQDRTVAVLVVDPSSPFTGGAILGDRVRMRDHFLDPGVFIRSMATRGASGGLSAIAPSAMRVLEAAGVDVIILETAGVGQTELDIMHTVDTVVVVVVPEAGDAIQTMKAGLLEIADVFVVNKSDRPGAKRMAADLEMTVHLGSRDADWWTTPVLQTEGIRNIGIPQLVEALESHHTTLNGHRPPPNPSSSPTPLRVSRSPQRTPPGTPDPRRTLRSPRPNNPPGRNRIPRLPSRRRPGPKRPNPPPITPSTPKSPPPTASQNPLPPPRGRVRVGGPPPLARQLPRPRPKTCPKKPLASQRNRRNG